MAINEDEYWTSSLITRSNFFEDDEDTSFQETDVFSSLLQPNITTLPIHSIISNKCLEIVLDDVTSTSAYVNPPPEETVRKMFHGENYILSVYQTLEEKLHLLDSAIGLSDGNSIVAITLFLKRTLKPNIFINQILKRKVALKHYANYLIIKNNLEELADLYMAAGTICNLKDIYYLLNKDWTNPDVVYKKLEQFSLHHAQNLYHAEDRTEIEENMVFLGVQGKHNCNNSSLIEHLEFLCRLEWGKGHYDGELVNLLKRQFKLDDFQFDWVIMSVLCKMKNWDKLLSTFTKSAWVTKKRALKSSIKPVPFILAISKYDPPKNIVEQFLSCTGDASKSLYLAEKLKIHLFVVTYYIEQKNKESLLEYIQKIEPGDQALYLAQNALSSSDIRWKN